MLRILIGESERIVSSKRIEQMVFLFFCFKERWVTSFPVFPDFDSPWLARACHPSNSSHMQLDRLEWRCPVWEDDAQPDMWAKSVYASSVEQRLQQVADSITLSEQRQAVCACLAFVICVCLASENPATSSKSSRAKRPRK